MVVDLISLRRPLSRAVEHSTVSAAVALVARCRHYGGPLRGYRTKTQPSPPATLASNYNTSDCSTELATRKTAGTAKAKYRVKSKRLTNE